MRVGKECGRILNCQVTQAVTPCSLAKLLSHSLSCSPSLSLSVSLSIRIFQKWCSVTGAKEADDCKRGYDVYTVHVDDHRILTVVTDSAFNLGKWLKEVTKASPNTKLGDTILVGVSAERITGSADENSRFDLLSLCVGSHCLFYLFPPRYDVDASSKSLNSFFDNPKIVAAAFNAVTLTKSLETLHGIKIKKAVDVHDVARRGCLDLWKCDLDEIAVAVVGKQMDVDRPERKEIPWFTQCPIYYWHNPSVRRTLTDDRIKFSTLDSYLCFLVASNEKTVKFSSAAKINNGKIKKAGAATVSSSVSVVRHPTSAVLQPGAAEARKLSKNQKRRIRKRKQDEKDRTVFINLPLLI